MISGKKIEKSSVFRISSEKGTARTIISSIGTKKERRNIRIDDVP